MTSKTLTRSYHTEWSQALAATLSLFDELCDLADELCAVPLASRNDRLREGLEAAFASRKPSSSLYLPVGVKVGGLPDRAFPAS